MKAMKRISVFVAALLSLCLLLGVFAGCGNKVEPMELQLNKQSVEFYIDETDKLTVTLSRELLEEEKIVWASENTAVATIKSSGATSATVTGKSEGTTTVSVSVGEATATCTVKVKNRTVTMTKPDDLTLDIDTDKTTLQLSATCTDNGAVTWTSSNTDVATVDENGLVTAVEVGTTTITASRGSAKDSAEVKVIASTRPADYYIVTRCVSNAAVVSGDPEVWYYFAKGADADKYEVASAVHQNNTVTMTLNRVDQDLEYYLRYQPDLEVGTAYTFTCSFTSSIDGYIEISQQKFQLTAGETVEISVTQTVSDSTPLNVRIYVFGGTAEAPLVLTLANYASVAAE